MGRNVKVILQPVTFRKTDHVAILSPDNSKVDAVIREIDSAEWSTGYRFWHMPLKVTTIRDLSIALKGVAKVDSSAFAHYQYAKDLKQTLKKSRNKIPRPTTDQALKLTEFCEEFKIKGYSEGTIKVYNSLLNVFFGYFQPKKDIEISRTDIETFMADYIDSNQMSANYKRLMANTLRRYFKFIGRNELSEISID